MNATHERENPATIHEISTSDVVFRILKPLGEKNGAGGIRLHKNKNFLINQ
jgi:hypothetical protein